MKNKLINKVSTAVVSIATVISLSGAGTLLPMAAHGATLEEQIAALLAQIANLQTQLAAQESAGTGTASATLTSSGDLTLGSKGAAVKALQQYSGAGSPGNETETFGSLTKKALAKWQAANGVSPAAGYFGPRTRAKMGGAAAAPAPAPTTGGTTPAPVVVVTPQGTGLTVTLAPDQPTATLAPGDAARIPFTKVYLTASADGDVTVTGLTVERTGLAADAALDSVLLLDDAGNQLGLKKTLSSEHKATVGESMKVAAGTTKVVTVAANRAAVGGSYGGQTLALRVTAVNTSAAVNGALPLTGTTHTINETLTIGSVTMARGPLDPGASQTKEIGTTSYTFSSVKVTAGSAEKVYLKSIRWNQTGSAGSSDLGNVKTVVDGTSYDTTISSDGKYYSSVFPGSGILIDKGFNKEVNLKGDVVSGSSRTIDFDLAKRTDLFVVGETYGYGIIPPQTGSTDPTDDTAAFSNTEDPWYDAAQVLVSTGTMTVSADNTVAAQNIAINLADQPLGGWSVDVKGEQISVGSIKMHITLTQSSGTTGLGLDDLDNVKLIDAATGKTLAGPVDPSSTALDTAGTANLTFTDTITFPVGVTKLKMVGKLAAGTTAFENNDTIVASTTPSSDWGTVTGQATGVTVTPSPTSKVSGQTMTAKGPAMTVSVSSVPIAQTVIAGVQQFEFAKYILDTAASGEDLRLTSLPLEYNIPSGSATDLTNCKLYDGATLLTTGGNVVNPSARGSSTSFTFDGTGLTLTKGATKQLSLKCDLKSAATGSYRWGYDSDSSPSPTGLVSGQSATVTENDNMGQLMSATTNGSFAVTLEATENYLVASPGETVTLSRLKYSATNEDVSIKQLTLILSDGASNTPVDLVNQEVTLWDGATKLGTATFSSNDNATSTTITGFTVPKDGSKVLTVKGTLAGISASGPLVKSGDLLKVDYDGGGGLTSNYGTGLSSGQTITPTSALASSTGVRIMRAYPTFEAGTLANKTLQAQDGLPLYRFKITAKQGDINLFKLSFSVSSSTAASSNATTTKFSLYAFTDSGYSSPDGDFSGANNAGGLINAGNCYNGRTSGASAATGGNLGTGSALVEIFPDKTGCALGTTTMKIPSGESRWFELRGSVGTLAPSGTAENLSVQLEGDSAYPTLTPGQYVGSGGVTAGTLGSASTINSDGQNDFIWSPRSTSSNESNLQYQYNLDWTNGYGVTGLPATNMTATTLSK
ncbi:MAG: peptidoglycan-binding protein [Candidatus Harrisonbacteria bacterium]|nr:peptidoglycan-binding protein [Candidatus Harrisonbacteria bacterium]